MPFDPVIPLSPEGLSPRAVLLNCVPSISRELVGNANFGIPPRPTAWETLRMGQLSVSTLCPGDLLKLAKHCAREILAQGVPGEVDEDAQGCTAHKRKALEAMSDGGEWMNCIYYRSEVFYSSKTEWISYNTKDKWREQYFLRKKAISRRMHIVFSFFKKFRNMQSNIANC